MKKFFFTIAALSVMAAACNKAELNPVEGGDETAPAANMIVETISGTTEMSTKATIAGGTGAFAWTAGDNIAVHVSNGTYVFTSDAGASGASTSAASASFTVVYPDGYSRDAFAVYPSRIISECSTANTNYGQAGHTLDVKLPSSYTLAQVSGDTTPCPMIATNTPGSGWEFKQLCGLLRLTVNSIPPSTKRMEIKFNGTKVSGEFYVAAGFDPDEPVLVPKDLNTYDVITITKDGTSDETLYSGWGDEKVFNIPLPVGTYGDIKITAYDALSGGSAVLDMTRSLKNGAVSYSAARGRGVKRIASFHVFSINSARTKRVVFAPGNLQATYNSAGDGSWTWGFAAHQYDYIGNAGGNKMITTTVKEATEPYAKLSGNGTVDLFGWSSSSTYYGIAKSEDNSNYYGSFVDWGSIDGLGGKSANYWKTMTSHSEVGYEWGDLMRQRATYATVNGTTNARFTEAKINTDGTTVNGVIIFPDYYVGPSENTDDITWGNIINAYNGSSESAWGKTSCTTAGWLTLESEGCVFLPAAGLRKGTNVTFDWIFYASRTPSSNSNDAWGWRVFQFQNSNTSSYYIYWDLAENKYKSAAVRLVHEVN